MLPPFFFPPSSFPVSVTVYCIVGSFTRHLLLSLYSDAMYRTLLQFLYQIFFIFVTFLFLDVAGEAFFISVLFYHLYFWMSSKMFFFFCLFFCFVLFCFMNLEISSQKRTERREAVLFFCVVKKRLFLFVLILLYRDT